MANPNQARLFGEFYEPKFDAWNAKLEGESTHFNMPTFSQSWNQQQEPQTWSPESIFLQNHQNSWQEPEANPFWDQQPPEFGNEATGQQDSKAIFEETMLRKMDMLLNEYQIRDKRIEEENERINLLELKVKRMDIQIELIAQEIAARNSQVEEENAESARPEMTEFEQQMSWDFDEQDWDLSETRSEMIKAPYTDAEIEALQEKGAENVCARYSEPVYERHMDELESSESGSAELVAAKAELKQELTYNFELSEIVEDLNTIAELEALKDMDAEPKSTKGSLGAENARASSSKSENAELRQEMNQNFEDDGMDLLVEISEIVEDLYIDVELEVAQEMEAEYVCEIVKTEASNDVLEQERAIAVLGRADVNQAHTGFEETIQLKPATAEPPKMELEPLPKLLKNAFLRPKDTIPIIIPAPLEPKQKEKLLTEECICITIQPLKQKLSLTSKIHLEIGALKRTENRMVEHFATNEGCENKELENAAFEGQNNDKKTLFKPIPISIFWPTLCEEVAKWCKGYNKGQKMVSHKWKQKMQNFSKCLDCSSTA